MRTLRVAMIGAGAGRGQSWISSLRKLSESSDLYDLQALCEVLPELAEANAKRWGVRAYTNLVALLDKEHPDVILNGIPPDGNSMVAGIAARRGVNVITEIPIAPTLAVADFMIETARENGVKLEVAEQVFLWAEEQLKRKIIDSGLVGPVTNARLYYANKADYHGINAVRMLIRSDARRVLGCTGRVPIPRLSHFTGDELTEDQWDHAVIEFENGVVCLFQSPPRARVGRRWDIEGSEGQLFGESLYIGSQSDFRHHPFVTEYTTVGGERVLDHVRVDSDPPVVFENPFRQYRAADSDEVARMQLLVGFHKAVVDQVQPEYGPENARSDIEILFAMRESARRDNAWIGLPLIQVTELERRIEEEFRRMYGYDPRDVEALASVNFPRGGVRYKVANWD